MVITLLHFLNIGRRGVSQISIADFPLIGNICLTKQGYIPKLFSFSLIQNERISENQSYSSDIIKIGDNVTTAKPSGKVIIDAKDVTMDAPMVIIDKGTTVAMGTSLKVINSKK
ncbi:MAG: hypothetical protein K2N05_03725 [Muribaculaceae bacterium]|nr:hypothetical protein [Muribaculaceae bacterium]